ncbi:PIG-L deacetylase family protein [Lentzea sp. NPDC051213]|uniref:PIG-L deacetylase family protein n=1 Tax=Lentzea sp. NPDC051213 TaxID=3364126 RepID=UPI00378DC303
MQFAGPRTLLVVHAHPTDESVHTGGVLAHYARDGARTVVITCTGGEFGIGPGGTRPGDPGHHPQAVSAHRRAELKAACDVMGIADLETLGYHDSGASGEVPDAGFCAVPADTIAGRIAALIERYRPQVVITHHSPHRDHMHALRATKLAIYRTGIPAKLYLTAREGATAVDISAVAGVKREALRCHASQGPDEAFAVREHYFRDLDTTNAPLPETDLFAGVTNHGPDLPRWGPAEVSAQASPRPR